jgi:two-component system sensor histidine kinase TctE
VLIVLPLIVVAALAAGARYVMAERMSRQIYDDMLLGAALTISRDVALSEGDILAEGLLDSLTQALGDRVRCPITGPEGRFVTGCSDVPAMPVDAVAARGKPVFYDVVALGRPVRAAARHEFIAAPHFGGWVMVQDWQTVNQRDALSVQLLLQAVLLMAVVIVSAALLVWSQINLGLHPLLQLHEAIALRSSDDLGRIRRPVSHEVRSPVDAMTALFVRLSDAFALRGAFISDAARQLCNPIAAIQARTEAATIAPDEAALRACAAALAKTARRAGRLTWQLLSMEKARGRTEVAYARDADLALLVGDVARRFAESAPRAGVLALFSVTGDRAPARVNRVMLEDAVGTMFDTARGYGCPDGEDIAVDLCDEAEMAVICISDDGPGIPEAARERVFDRFYRLGDNAAGGCGLGLAIVRHVADAHGDELCVIGRARGAAEELRTRSFVDQRVQAVSRASTPRVSSVSR